MSSSPDNDMVVPLANNPENTTVQDTAAAPAEFGAAPAVQPATAAPATAAVGPPVVSAAASTQPYVEGIAAAAAPVQAPAANMTMGLMPSPDMQRQMLAMMANPDFMSLMRQMAAITRAQPGAIAPAQPAAAAAAEPIVASSTVQGQPATTAAAAEPIVASSTVQGQPTTTAAAAEPIVASSTVQAQPTTTAAAAEPIVASSTVQGQPATTAAAAEPIVASSTVQAQPTTTAAAAAVDNIVASAAIAPALPATATTALRPEAGLGIITTADNAADPSAISPLAAGINAPTAASFLIGQGADNAEPVVQAAEPRGTPQPVSLTAGARRPRRGAARSSAVQASRSRAPTPPSEAEDQSADSDDASSSAEAEGSTVAPLGQQRRAKGVTLRLTQGKAGDVKKAKNKFLSQLQLIGDYEELAKAGEPLWEFLRDKWPYGIIDRAKNDVFSRGLTMKVGKDKKGYCPPEETVRRLGFSKADQAHVLATFVLAFQAFVALELIGNGEGCLSKDVRHTNWKHLELTLDILQQNPVIKLWFDPPQHYIHSLYHIVKKGLRLQGEDNGAETADRQADAAAPTPGPSSADQSSTGAPSVARDGDAPHADEPSAGIDERSDSDDDDTSSDVSDDDPYQGAIQMNVIKKNVTLAHRHLAQLAIKTTLFRFWSQASSTWMSASKQRHADERSQWEELRQQCSDTDFKQPGDKEGFEGCWLPPFDVAFKEDLMTIVSRAQSRVASIHERRREIQERADQERRRIAQMQALLEAAPNKKAKRKAQRKQNLSSKKQRVREAQAEAQAQAQATARDQGEESDETGEDMQADQEQQVASDNEDNEDDEAAGLLPEERVRCHPDKWYTRCEGSAWATIRDASYFKKLLMEHSVVKLDESAFDDILAFEADTKTTAGTIEVEVDPNTPENDVEGLDADLTADQCLRALTYIFLSFKDCAVSEAPVFNLPSRQELQKYEPFDICELGFKRSQPALRLSLTQLQACLWFARRVIFDTQQRVLLKRNNPLIVTDKQLERERDYSTGGVIADPPGLGKTLTAISFALIYRKLGVVDLPCLFIVMASVARQFITEFKRYVDLAEGGLPSAPDGCIRMLDLTGSKAEEKCIPSSYIAKECWTKHLFIFATNKSSGRGKTTKQNRYFPFHGANKYGSVFLDECQDLPHPDAASFPAEFQVKRHFTIGLSATPISNIENFFFIMSYCGHPSAKIESSDAAIKISHELKSDNVRNAGAQIYHAEILKKAKSRDRKLEDMKMVRGELETDLAKFIQKELPKPGDTVSPNEFGNLFRQLVDITISAVSCDTSIKKMQKQHAQFHKALRNLYIFPSGDRTTGPFVLKRGRAGADNLPALHEYTITTKLSNHHARWSNSLSASVVNELAEHLLLAARTSSQRLKARPEAEKASKNKTYQCYNVYHPALYALAFQDGANALPLYSEASQCFKDLGSKKGQLVVQLVVRMLQIWGEYNDRNGSARVPTALPQLSDTIFPPRLPDGERPQKIVIYCQHAQVCAFIAWLMDDAKIKFLNLFGGDNKETLRDRIRRWSVTRNVPVLFLSSALSTGINIPEANVLIFAERNSNELEDQQVKGRIVRTGQTREQWIFNLLCRESYDETIRVQGRAKLMNQAPIALGQEALRTRIVDFAKLGKFPTQMDRFQQWYERLSPAQKAAMDRAAAHACALPQLERSNPGPLPTWQRFESLLPKLLQPAEDSADEEGEEHDNLAHDGMPADGNADAISVEDDEVDNADAGAAGGS